MVHVVHSAGEFHAAVAKPNLTVVDFYAEWCGPCKMIAPFLEKLSQEHADVQFIKVDVDELNALASELGISAMPTFKFYKNGQLLEEFRGANKDRLLQLLLQYK